ncbi:MAG: DUF5683 domain-containing protein [Ignavibacteria bacterium]
MLKKILLINFILIISSTYAQEIDTLNINIKSPWGAVIRSAVFPGLGQIYNHSYWKAPIVWGLMGWFGYNWWQNDKKYEEYQKFYLETVQRGNENFLYKRIREFYHDQRDLFAIYLGLTYFLNMVDAYVDAHLFNFELLTRNDELKLILRIKL